MYSLPSESELPQGKESGIKYMEIPYTSFHFLCVSVAILKFVKLEILWFLFRISSSFFVADWLYVVC